MAHFPLCLTSSTATPCLCAGAVTADIIAVLFACCSCSSTMLLGFLSPTSTHTQWLFLSLLLTTATAAATAASGSGSSTPSSHGQSRIRICLRTRSFSAAS